MNPARDPDQPASTLFAQLVILSYVMYQFATHRGLQSSRLIQPMAAEDVASAVCRVALGSPVNGTVEVGGPEKFRLYELVRQDFAACNDPREVVADPLAGYYGIKLNETMLIPGRDAWLGETRFETWLSQSINQVPAANRRPAKEHSCGEQLMASLRPMLVLPLLVNSTLMAQEAKVTTLMSNDLSEFPGKEGMMITVDYPPGCSDPVHHHNAHAFLYALEGSVVMQVKGGKKVILTARQSFL